MIALDPAWIALIGTLFGGIGLKIIEKWLNKGADKRLDREELRKVIDGLNDRVDKLEEEITLWRSRYYAEQEEVALLRTHLILHNVVPPERRAPII